MYECMYVCMWFEYVHADVYFVKYCLRGAIHWRLMRIFMWFLHVNASFLAQFVRGMLDSLCLYVISTSIYV